MKTTIILVSAIILFIGVAHGQVAVIANKSVSEISISRSQLVDIYTLSQTTWPEKMQIVVVDIKIDTPAKQKFYSYLGKSALDVKKAWMRVMLSGEGKAPEGLSSEEEVLQKVSSTPGAIGYISASKVKGDVKVLTQIN